MVKSLIFDSNNNNILNLIQNIKLIYIYNG